MSMMVLCSAIGRFFTAGEPVASRAADGRWASQRIHRRAQFTDCCRDNRLAHQTRCDHSDSQCDGHRVGPPVS